MFYRSRDLQVLFKINEMNKKQDNVLCVKNKVFLTRKDFAIKEIIDY